jgi:hypothetical protein
MTTIERVRVAFETYSVGPEGPYPGVCRIRHGREIIEEFPGWTSPEAVARCRQLNARAAIEALREPTGAMLAAGAQAHMAEFESADEITYAVIFRAMIDAALAG